MNAVVVVAGILVVCLLIALATYNNLMHLRQQVRSAWAGLDQQFKRRYEIISLISSLRSVLGDEVGRFVPAVIAGKNLALIAVDPVEHVAAEALISAGIDQLLGAMANPASRSIPQTVDVYTKLMSNQKQIGQACRLYNQRVSVLNGSMRNFPNDLTARVLGIQPQPIFDLGD